MATLRLVHIEWRVLIQMNWGVSRHVRGRGKTRDRPGKRGERSAGDVGERRRVSSRVRRTAKRV